MKEKKRGRGEKTCTKKRGEKKENIELRRTLEPFPSFLPEVPTGKGVIVSTVVPPES